jgi:upstream activation factor subunit UAF30
VPQDVRAKYINIIDSILNTADLTTITRKDIRAGIQDKVEYDITPHKVGLTGSKRRLRGLNQYRPLLRS